MPRSRGSAGATRARARAPPTPHRRRSPSRAPSCTRTLVSVDVSREDMRFSDIEYAKSVDQVADGAVDVRVDDGTTGLGFRVVGDPRSTASLKRLTTRSRRRTSRRRKKHLGLFLE